MWLCRPRPAVDAWAATPIAADDGRRNRRHERRPSVTVTASVVNVEHSAIDRAWRPGGVVLYHNKPTDRDTRRLRGWRWVTRRRCGDAAERARRQKNRQHAHADDVPTPSRRRATSHRVEEYRAPADEQRRVVRWAWTATVTQCSYYHETQWWHGWLVSVWRDICVSIRRLADHFRTQWRRWWSGVGRLPVTTYAPLPVDGRQGTLISSSGFSVSR